MTKIRMSKYSTKIYGSMEHCHVITETCYKFAIFTLDSLSLLFKACQMRQNMAPFDNNSFIYLMYDIETEIWKEKVV